MSASESEMMEEEGEFEMVEDDMEEGEQEVSDLDG